MLSRIFPLIGPSFGFLGEDRDIDVDGPKAGQVQAANSFVDEKTGRRRPCNAHRYPGTESPMSPRPRRREEHP